MKTNSKLDARSLDILTLAAGACTLICTVCFFATSLFA